MIDFLLPSTDAGAVAQVAAAIVVFVVLLVLVRRDRAGRLLVTGVGLVTLSLFGLRMLH